MSTVNVRLATEADAEALLTIYVPYVRETGISFEYIPPTAEEFRGRIRDTLSAYPFLVAEGEAGIVGYAYASRFQTRAAYGWSAETSVYIAQDARRGGTGRILYEALLALLCRQGVQNVYACIACPNEPSVAFHEAMGFVLKARFSQCGYKLGQ
ncbi:MAG: GNAT family N-acetyltransferase [Clostridia bacterium]|nr:GNAT family N-acetyltransferase [Clostridia bacterium]